MKSLLDKLRRIVTKTEVEPKEESEEAAFAYTVLFVCMGNICRSPTAEGAFKHVLAERAPDLSIRADSAGTHAYHVGEPPDRRAQRAAERRGIDLSEQKARRVREEDFASFDLVIAMDELNLELLVELSPPEYHDRIKLFLDYAPQLGRRDVPDPYYGGSNGFELVLDLIEDASIGLLEQLRDNPIVRGESRASS